ncbi:hypothetical protein DL96DRAFT_1824446 [Flagelloscypha sp. PMI_526]|nr:hypothetical protein DL96DRAFT_1824446 [Flagelloscypha sp. PMI_526]
MLSPPNEQPRTRSQHKRRHSTLEDASAYAPAHPSKRTRHPVKVLPKQDAAKHERTAHIQSQSAFLHILPAEILDMIFGDLVLNERDHIALSGTCTLLRLGYTEQVWQTMIPGPIHPNTVRTSHFTLALLSDPSRSRIFSTALSRTASVDTPGIINLMDKCDNQRHKRKRNCNCIRFMGPAHGKVVRGVNAKLTAWGRIESRYQSLSSLIDPAQAGFRFIFPSADRWRQNRGDGTKYYCYCLATVDAAIWNAAGGAAGVRDIWEKQVEAHRRGEYEPPQWEGYRRIQGCRIRRCF